MIEHTLAFFIGSVLLILWGVGTTALGYFSIHPFDRYRHRVITFFIYGVMLEIVVVIICALLYILGWLILNALSVIINLL